MASRSRLNRIPLILGILALAFSSFACSLFSPAAAPTQTAIPTAVKAVTQAASKTPAATPTQALSAVETETPTVEPVVESSPTPVLSPTPKGFYSQGNGGFSVQASSDWDLADDTGGGLVFDSRTGPVRLVIYSFPEEEAMTEDQLKDNIKSGFGSDFTLTIKESAKAQFGEGVEALRVASALSNSNGDFILWTYYAHSGSRGYIVYAFGSQDLPEYSDPIEGLLATLRLFKPEPYNLPNGETLLQLGGIPTEKELDPAITGASAADYVGLLFSGLVRLTPEMEVMPELAESWTISEDGTAYIFKIRAGLMFSNGDPLTAQDVKDSWERALDPKTGSPTAYTYLGDIAGAKEKLDGKANEVSGLKVVDELTLSVTLDGPKPYFLAKITYPTAFVVDGKQVKNGPKDWMFNPAGSGPYQVREYIEDEAFLFERNPRFYNPPAVKYLVFLFNAGGSPMSLYEEGTIDMVYPPYDQLEKIKEPGHALHDQLYTTPTLCTSMVMLNANQPPLDDPLVRKALWLAVDRDAWVEKISQGNSILDDSVLPPAMPGYNADRPVTAYDLAAAKEALAKSKYAGKPVSITLTVQGFAGSDSLGVTLLVDGWKKNLGIDVKVEYLEPENFNEQALAKTNMQLMMYGWCADYPDPENFLDVLFHSSSKFNLSHVSRPEADVLLEQARVEADPGRRIELYQQAESLLLENYDVIPLGHSVNSILVKPRVKNFVLAPMHVAIIPLLELAGDQ